MRQLPEPMLLGEDKEHRVEVARNLNEQSIAKARAEGAPQRGATNSLLQLWPEIPVISTELTPFIECIIPLITSYK